MNDQNEVKTCSLTGTELCDPLRLAWLLLNAHTDAMMLIHPDGTIIFANQALAQLLNRATDEIVGTSVWDVYPPDKLNHRKIVLNGVLQTGVPARFVDRYGDDWYEVVIQLIGEAVGSTVAFYARNVTRRVEAEERLKRTSLRLITTQEDERRRIAQDLHDDIGQRMTTLLLGLRSVENGVRTGQVGVEDQVKEAIESVTSMTKQIRQILYQLRPPLLATLPLASVLDDLCTSFAQSSGLHVDFSSDDDLPPIPEAQATALYRFVQEGLNNVIKHAKAHSVWVNLDCIDGEISLSLEDDGEGFSPDGKVRPGLGLLGIRDRFLMLNGSFTIESASGKGTRLSGSLPLSSDSL